MFVTTWSVFQNTVTNVFKRIQVRVPKTSHLITYCNATFEDGKRARISSAYVCLNYQQHSEIPKFGQIKRLFSHEFGDKSTLFAEVDDFNSPQLNKELKMWFTFLNPMADYSAMFPLEAFSEPLVIAIDKRILLFGFSTINTICDM